MFTEITMQGHAPTVELVPGLPAPVAPAILIVRTETQRVGCPYCLSGYTEITAEHKAGGGMDIRRFKQPHACALCGRYFTLEARVQIVGRAITGRY